MSDYFYALKMHPTLEQFQIPASDALRRRYGRECDFVYNLTLQTPFTLTNVDEKVCTNVIGADCWRVQTEKEVLYDTYASYVPNQPWPESPERDRLIYDKAYVFGLLEGGTHLKCELFGDHLGGIYTFYARDGILFVDCKDALPPIIHEMLESANWTLHAAR